VLALLKSGCRVMCLLWRSVFALLGLILNKDSMTSIEIEAPWRFVGALELKDLL
jgi:hypothetical protein